ncbi:MAG: cupredoxin, partial [Rugosibacter sp.]
MKKLVMITALMSLGFTGPTFAHGDEEHDNKGAMEHHEDHAAALGEPGDLAKVSRTVEINMSD